VTLPVTGITISGRVFWTHGMPVSEWLRLPLSGSQWDIRWLSRHGNTLTLYALSVFTLAVLEKFCDACGDGNTTSGRYAQRLTMLMSERHQLPLAGSRWDIGWLSGH
jgi:hypothetical protein